MFTTEVGLLMSAYIIHWYLKTPFFPGLNRFYHYDGLIIFILLR